MTALSETKKYQDYPEYKDSGVEWVGDIPVEWEMWKLSHAYREIGSGTTPPTTSDEWFGGDIPWVTTGELRETVINGTKKNVSKKTIDTFSALRIYPAGSVAMAMYGATIGRLGIFGVDATTNQACCVMTASDVIDNKYLFYWLWAFRQDIINLSSGGGQPNINQEKVASLKISAPIIDEQTQIANFLDHETAKIDTLIEKQQQLIKLLKEKRQAVISHAVTKGLNPQAPMKDSGVEWLGEVPEHWRLSTLRWYLSVNSGEYLNNKEFDVYQTTQYSYPVVGGNGVMGFTSKYNNEDVLVVGRVGALCGNVHHLIDKVWVTDNALKISNHPQYEKPYLNQFLRVLDLNRLANHNTQPLITGTMIKDQIAIVPTKTEQREIASFVDQKVKNFDVLINKCQTLIELSKERRTALISAAVTGKIDVRNWQAPTSEYQAMEQTA
ncbi:restriction endonuclease subunit S [Vibrio fluvialis]|nr:restriction endonuclease subunit S [Vibrio fluvialis]